VATQAGRVVVWLTCLAALVGAVGLGACRPSSDGAAQPVPVPVNLDEVAGAAGVRAVRLAEPLAKPDVPLVDTAGEPYDVRARTAGRLVLMFFGFTRCSNVCPTTMADLAAALGLVDPAVADQVVVVFVTGDPDHDTGPVTRRWLDQFDSSFVGLSDSFDAVSAYAAKLGVRLEPARTNPDGSVVVGHSSQVTAFGPDGVAHVVYEAGTTVADYAHDIPLLVRGEF
jgi:protein SCO1/2